MYEGECQDEACAAGDESDADSEAGGNDSSDEEEVVQETCHRGNSGKCHELEWDDSTV